MARGVNIDDLAPEIQKKVLKATGTRRRAFTKENVRTHAILVLAEVASLTQDQRRQVLEHAIKVNRA